MGTPAGVALWEIRSLEDSGREPGLWGRICFVVFVFVFVFVFWHIKKRGRVVGLDVFLSWVLGMCFTPYEKNIQISIYVCIRLCIQIQHKKAAKLYMRIYMCI